jgi:N-acetylmuramoyl-L-alanine amidase
MFNNNQINIFLTFLWGLTFYFHLNNFALALNNEEQAVISEIKFNDQDLTSSKLQIKISKKTNFKIYTLKNPWRLVMDIENARLADQDYQPQLPNFIKNFQITDNEIYLRFEFALQKKINLEKSFFDSKNSLITAVIVNEKADLSMFIEQNEIINDQPNQFNNQQNNPTNSSNNNLASINQNPENTTTLTINNPNPIDSNSSFNSETLPKKSIDQPLPTSTTSHKMPVIVIDSGHGGKDPGTIGNYLRSKEKNITLSYAKELYKQLKASKEYKVYLTRHKDIFINLKKRVELARQKKADLFISLHVNAIGDEDVTGFSIYTLSEQSSDKQAELLAKKENQADIIHGVDFSGASVDIMKTLIDMSQRSVKNESAIFANKVIKHVKQADIEILQNTHRFAGFAVLTAPDMASVLVELGYLSNPQEEKLLNNISYKRKICQTMVKAIEEYFSKTKK